MTRALSNHSRKSRTLVTRSYTMRVVECEQGSAAWLQARLGNITASRVCEALSKFKTKQGETMERYNYRVDMIVERLTNRSTENFISPEMIWGREHEDEA